MKRDTSNLENRIFDVLIIGGGIHGAATARECAQAGLKVALVEKNDFGSATSANSLKIIHGGLRYLQHLNIKRMRESILSRRFMAKLAPHNVKPLACIIPNSGHGLRSNTFMRIALKINDLIAFDRNKGIEKESQIPSGRIITHEEFKRLFPKVQSDTIAGGSLWYDAIALNSERLTLRCIHDAVNYGAVVANYTQITDFLTENNTIKGGLVSDSLKNRSLKVQAKAVIVTGGAWNDIITGKIAASQKEKKNWAKAVNIIVKKEIFGDRALGLTGEVDFEDKDAVLKKKGRLFFFVPWRGYTMIGTTYTPFHGSPDEMKAKREDARELLSQVNTIYPAAELSMDDVTKIHAGLVPAQSKAQHSDDVQLEKETEISDYSDGGDGIQGLFTIKSVKFTTAPIVAKHMRRRIVAFLNHPTLEEKQKKRANELPLPEEMSEELGFLKNRYGKELELVIPFITKNAKKICHDPLLLAGEIDYFLEEEMACTLSDIVFRRSELGTAECPKESVLRETAQYIGNHFGWDTEKIDNEIKSVVDAFVWE